MANCSINFRLKFGKQFRSTNGLTFLKTKLIRNIYQKKRKYAKIPGRCISFPDFHGKNIFVEPNLALQYFVIQIIGGTVCKQPGLWSTHGRPIDHSSDARGCWSHRSKYSQEYKAKTITQINSFYCIINDLPESDATTARAESVWKRLKSENKAEKLAIQLYYSLEKQQQHI